MLSGVGASLGAFLWRRRTWPLLLPVSKVAAVSGFITAFIYAWLAGFQIPAQRTMSSILDSVSLDMNSLETVDASSHSSERCF